LLYISSNFPAILCMSLRSLRSVTWRFLIGVFRLYLKL
jgi:hypothetical protein